uniref:Saposin B-type domain-containing protein n=1 Tax=Strongyloides stercoralis TaxID=6248 RepID=A0A0K0DUG4_STRER
MFKTFILLLFFISSINSQLLPPKNCGIIKLCNNFVDIYHIEKCIDTFIQQNPLCIEELNKLELYQNIRKRSSSYDNSYDKRNFKIFQQLRQLQRIPVGKRNSFLIY